jgi:putative drug exporter of the RND superfamily
MSALARWCFRHRFTVIVAWLGLLAALAGISNAVKTTTDNSFLLPGTGSANAIQLLQRTVPAQAGDSDTIVWHVDHGSVRDPEVQARISAMLARVAHAPEVVAVASPYAPPAGSRGGGSGSGGQAAVSRDGRTAFATVNFTQRAGNLDKADITRVIDIAQAARAPGLAVELGGQAIQQSEQQPLSGASAIGIAAAAVILFIAFGSLFAMVLPIVTAIAGVGSGLLLIAPLSHAVTMVDFAPILGALIGLGVGIDYALFIVTRYRRALLSGLRPLDAVAEAAGTSGRAVVFAGGTVCIALLGILTLGVGFLDGLALAAAVTVVCTVVAASTLLPALLGVFGVRVISRRQLSRIWSAGPEPAERTSGAWVRWARTVQRRPVALAVVATAVMLTLSIPVLHLRLGASDASNDPASSTSRQAYDLLADGFGPGFNGPLLVVAQTHSAADTRAVDRLTRALPGVPGVASVTSGGLQGGRPPAGGRAQPPRAGVEVISVTPTTSPEAKQTSDLIRKLRGEVIPRYTHGTTAQVYVGGETASFDDFAALTSDKLPLFLAAIVGLSFLLLMLAFRSLVIPATAAVMNLLAGAAAYGVLTAFFEWGWGTSAFGLGKAGPIEAFLPVVTLAILFGLSMDYQVFLVSRMTEEWSRTGQAARSVRVGQTETARVITAAASIMIAVFVAFVFMSERAVAEFGVGLAAAVALDAFVLRTVLVPAAMHLFGRANWWLPRWLDRRLPRLAVEPPATQADRLPTPV